MNARLEELRTKFQENPRRYFAPFANELRKTGDTAQAIAICRTHLAGQPGHVSGHIVLGQALYEAGEATEARDIFTAALDLDPENLIALRTMGEIAQVNGEFGTARHWYERLLDADPRNTEVAQLLRDIPAASEPASFAPPASEPEPTVADAPVEEKPTPSAAGFHTTYTGAAPAYEPRVKFEAPPAPPAEEPVEAHFVSELPAEPEPAPVFETEPAEAAAVEGEIEMVDMDAFLTSAGEAPADVDAPAPLPDEAEVFAASAPAVEVDTPAAAEAISIEDFAQPAVSEEPAEDLPSFGEAGLQVDTPANEPPAADVEPAEPVLLAESQDERDPEPADAAPYESPRASFAEHGFDGEVDQVGWITPSAAYSDLESAPEDWFVEAEATADAAQAPEAEVEAEAEPQPEEAAETAAEDSWFAEAESPPAPVAESEEYWMPDFSSVGGSEPTASDVRPPETEEMWMPDFSAVGGSQPAPADASSAPLAPAMSAAPDEDGRDVLADTEDAIVVEHPTAAFGAPDGTRDRDDIHEFASALGDAGDSLSEAPLAASPAAGEVPAVPAGAAPATEVAVPEPEPAIAARAEFPDPSVGHTPSFSAVIPSSTPAPAPFVTETLAELYLQQGFREEAIAIYRQLADRDPSDQSLRLRIEAIQHGAASDVMQAADAPEAARRGPSVRSFFSKLAHRAPVSFVSTPQADRAAPDAPFATAASALANMFAASRPAPADEGAATTLASAFTDPAGRPSRAADRELSLDHLFRDPAGGPEAGSIMLDEFYASPGASAPPEAPAPDESEGADIRQFTAWLEGLRKK